MFMWFKGFINSDIFINFSMEALHVYLSWYFEEVLVIKANELERDVKATVIKFKYTLKIKW